MENSKRSRVATATRRMPRGRTCGPSHTENIAYGATRWSTTKTHRLYHMVNSRKTCRNFCVINSHNAVSNASNSHHWLPKEGGKEHWTDAVLGSLILVQRLRQQYGVAMQKSTGSNNGCILMVSH